MRRFARVIRLMPGERQTEQAPDKGHRERAPNVQRDVPFEHSPGAMKCPAADREQHRARKPQPSFAQMLRAAQLKRVDRFAGDIGHGEQDELRQNEKRARCHQGLTLTLRQPPEFAIQMRYASLLASAACRTAQEPTPRIESLWR